MQPCANRLPPSLKAGCSWPPRYQGGRAEDRTDGQMLLSAPHRRRGPARKALPDLEIIEIEPVIVSEYLHGRCLRSQQALKCLSSFHYSENLLIEIQADLLHLRPLKPSEKGKWPILRHHYAPWRKGDDQRDIRLPGQSCLAYDPPRLLHAPLPRDREKVSGSRWA